MEPHGIADRAGVFRRPILFYCHGIRFWMGRCVSLAGHGCGVFSRQ